MGRPFIMPGKIYSGVGALNDSINEISSLGSKALIVTSKGCWKRNSEVLSSLLDSVSIKYVIYDGINSEPTTTMINEGLKIYKDNNCDFLIGFGGGSPLDSIKAIGALVTNTGSISDYMDKTITIPVPPMVAIPTTAGTGSEATKFTIITDTNKNIKMLLKGDVLMPNLAILEPTFTLSTPQGVTVATGMDALIHSIEAYTSKMAQPLTDTLAISAIKKIMKNLPLVYDDGSNIEARSEMLISALEAGLCINNSSVTIIHGMSRPIGALFHVPHGLSNAMLIKECFTFALSGNYCRFANLGRAIGVPNSSSSNDKLVAEEFLNALINLCDYCKVPTLAEYGINKDEFLSCIDKMSDDAIASGSPNNTYRTPTKNDIMEIYKHLW